MGGHSKRHFSSSCNWMHGISESTKWKAKFLSVISVLLIHNILKERKARYLFLSGLEKMWSSIEDLLASPNKKFSKKVPWTFLHWKCFWEQNRFIMSSLHLGADTPVLLTCAGMVYTVLQSKKILVLLISLFSFLSLCASLAALWTFWEDQYQLAQLSCLLHVFYSCQCYFCLEGFISHAWDCV